MWINSNVWSVCTAATLLAAQHTGQGQPNPVPSAAWCSYLERIEVGDWASFAVMDGEGFRAQFWPALEDPSLGSDPEFLLACSSSVAHWAVGQASLAVETRDGYCAEALVLLTKAAELEHWLAMLETAWMHEDGLGTQPDLDRAIDWSRRALEACQEQFGGASPQTISTMARLADRLWRHGDYAESDALYLRVLGIGEPVQASAGGVPQNPIQLSRNLPAEAQACLKEANRLIGSRRFAEAAAKFQEYLTFDAENIEALQRLGACQLETNRAQDAAATLHSALERDPANARTLLLLGITQVELNQFDAALEILTRAAQRDANNPETFNYLGIVSSQKGLPGQAEAMLRKAVDLSPNYPAAQFNLSIVYATQNPPKGLLAQTHYRKAIELGHARNGQLEALLSSGQHDPVLANRFGARQITTTGWKASWSPDRRLIACRKHPGEGLVVIDLETNGTTNLTAFGKDPSWSPDGRFIAYVRVRRENPGQSEYLAEQIWMVDAVGGEPLYLANGGYPAWSSDSKWVYFHSRTDNKIWGVPVEHPAAARTLYFDRPPSWYSVISPTGEQIAGGTNGKFVILDRATGSTVREWEFPGMRGALAAWSPDGQQIALGGYNDDLLGLWLLDVQSGAKTQIAAGPYTCPEWSKDGRQLAFDFRSGELREIWIIDRERLPGLEQTPLSDGSTPFANTALGHSAETIQQRIREVIKEYPQLAPLVKLWTKLGKAINQGRLQEALSLSQQLAETSERIGGAELAVGARIVRALILQRMGRHAEATAVSEEAFARLENAENNRLGPGTSAFPWSILGQAYYAVGNPAQAVRLLQRALVHQERAPNPEPRALAELLNYLAGAYNELGAYDQAQQSYRRAIALFESALGPRHQQTAVVLDNLGISYEKAGEYDQAALAHERALEIFEAVLGPEHVDTGVCLVNLAKLHDGLGQDAKAESFLLRALSVVQKNWDQNPRLAGTVLTSLGGLYTRLGDYSEAEPLLELGSRLSEQRNGPGHPETSAAWSRLAILHLDRGEFAKAEALERRALELTEQAVGPEHPYTATRLANLAVIYSRMGKVTAAIPLLERSVRIAQKRLGPDHLETPVHLGSLARLYLATDRKEAALDLARQVQAAQLKVLNRVLSFTSERERLAFQRTLEPYGLFASLGAAPELALAALRHKGVVLDSLLEDRLLAQVGASPENQELVDRLRAAKQRLMQRVLEEQNDPGSTLDPARSTETTKLSKEVETLEATLVRRVTGVGRSRRALQVTVEEVQGALPLGTVLLEFVRYPSLKGINLTEASYGVLVIAPAGVPKWISLGPAAPIEEAVRQFQEAVRGRVGDPVLTTISQALYERVWAPLEPSLARDTTRIAVSPDGALNFVSFAALLTPDDRFLGQKYSLVYVASGRDLLARKLRPRTAQLMIYANPDFAGTAVITESGRSATDPSMRSADRRSWQQIELRALPGTAKEAAALADRARQWKWPSEVFSESRATEAALNELNSPRALHLATHGFILPEIDHSSSIGSDLARGVAGIESLTAPSTGIQAFEKPWFAVLRSKNPMHQAGLALAGAQATLDAWKRGETPPAHNDGIVTAAELSQLKLQGTELVVLSACDSGMGQYQSGEGILGLRRGCSQAGARHLLLTLWPVADDETARMMLDFYDAYHASGEPALALAEVQRNWLLHLRRERGLWVAVALAGPFLVSTQ